MSNTFILKESSEPGKVPIITDLALGELAVNSFDGRVFMKKDVSGVQSIIEVSTQYNNSGTQFTSSKVNDVLTEIDGILDTKVVIDSDASLVGVLFDTLEPSSSTQKGSTRWNRTVSTLETVVSDSTVLLHGQEVLYHVENGEAFSLSPGTLVMYKGSMGASGKLLVERYDGISDAHLILGVVTESIPPSGVGFVTHFGKVTGVDTTNQNGESWINGDILYASQTNPGALTKNPPSSPGIKMSVAVVASANVNGALFVRPYGGTSLKDNSQIELGTLTNNDILQYNSTNSRFENTTTPAFSELTVGTPTHNMTVESDGTIVFNGNATVWVDLDFPIVIPPDEKANDPTMVSLAGNLTAPQWSINDLYQCEGQELPHFWKQESAIQFHCHIITNGVDTNDRYVAFQLEFARANINGQLETPQVVTSSDFLIPANTPDRTHFILPIYTLSMTGYNISTHIYCLLTRVSPQSGTSPTNDIFCTMLQAHIECDTFGSRTTFTK